MMKSNKRIKKALPLMIFLASKVPQALFISKSIGFDAIFSKLASFNPYLLSLVFVYFAAQLMFFAFSLNMAFR